MVDRGWYWSSRAHDHGPPARLSEGSRAVMGDEMEVWGRHVEVVVCTANDRGGMMWA
jgi:hypothetical protein